MALKHFVRRTFVPILNIIGMSISLMVFLVLFAQVWFDYRFNRNFEDYENIYRLEMPVTMFDAMDYKYDQMTLRPLIEEFERCSPDIVAACDYEDLENEFREKIVVNDNGTTRKYKIPFAHSDSSLPDVFTLELIAGRVEDYRNENDILLSEGYASMIFGDENPIGKIITFEMLTFLICPISVPTGPRARNPTIRRIGTDTFLIEILEIEKPSTSAPSAVLSPIPVVPVS